MPFRKLSLILVCVASVVCTASVATAQTPPPQPATGPGGADYPHAASSAFGPYYPPGREGDNNFRYFIYQPSQPKPATAPVVLFLHGYFANAPEIYGVWMGHMARKGFTVIWVQYDRGLAPPRDFPNNAIESYRDALARIVNDTSGTFVRPARGTGNEILSGITGHSLGGYLTLVLAARSTEAGSGLPVPKALVAVEPAIGLSPGADFRRIPSSTKLVFLAGADDTLVCKSGTQTLWNFTPQIPASNKEFLAMRSDSNGGTELRANHVFPLTVPIVDKVDARDFYGTWKLSVAAMQCAFSGANCEYALSDGGPLEVSMGAWSDGRPVTPLLWAATPDAVALPCETATQR